MTVEKKLDRIALDYSPMKDFDRYCIEYGANLIVRNSHKEGILLEVSCSEGLMTEVFAKYFDEIVVVDGSEYYLNITKDRLKHYKNIIYSRQLIEDFNIDLKFDNIVMASILEHLDDPVLVLKKARCFLKKNGAIHIIVPNAESLHRQIGEKMGLIKRFNEFSERDKMLGHKRVYNKEMLLKQLSTVGLKVVCFDGILLKPLSNAQMENWGENVIQDLFAIGHQIPDWCNQLYVKVKI